MYDIYYAHHQWKYGTKVETYELNLIKRYFPNAKIFNPSTDLTSLFPQQTEDLIMEECLETVRNSDILVFSSVDGCIGTGVYREIMEAQNNEKIVFYIHDDSLHINFNISEREDSGKTDRLFAKVTLDLW